MGQYWSWCGAGEVRRRGPLSPAAFGSLTQLASQPSCAAIACHIAPTHPQAMCDVFITEVYSRLTSVLDISHHD